MDRALDRKNGENMDRNWLYGEKFKWIEIDMSNYQRVHMANVYENGPRFGWLVVYLPLFKTK